MRRGYFTEIIWDRSSTILKTPSKPGESGWVGESFGRRADYDFTIDQKVLERYLPVYNRRFSKPAAKALSVWRKVSSLQIEQALCFKERRTVAKDNTITFDGTVFQIPKKSPFRSHANKRIDVHVLLDGAIELFYQNEKIASFDSKTTHAFGLYRTNGKREGFRYGPLSNLTTQTHELSP